MTDAIQSFALTDSIPQVGSVDQPTYSCVIVRIAGRSTLAASRS